MTALSSAGWIVHDVGLAATIGGSMFGQFALETSLDEVSKPVERDRLSAKAWNKYSWWKLAGHAAFAIPWAIGRTMLSGNEATGRARVLTVAKDILVGTSLVSGLASFFIGRTVSKKSLEGRGPDQVRSGKADEEEPDSSTLEKTVAVVGTVNLLATIGVLAVTSLLAMEGSKSLRFAATTRKLP